MKKNNLRKKVKKRNLRQKVRILLVKAITKVKDLLEIYQRKYIIKLVEQTAIEAGYPPGTKTYKEGLAVLKAESKLNPHAINWQCAVGDDYGIAQFNSYYYWQQEKIISPQDALKPEKALPVFWEYFPERKSDWITYRSGDYKTYLKRS